MKTVPTFHWFFEYQPIASVILTQPSRYKRAESNLQADEKGPQHWIQVFVYTILLAKLKSPFYSFLWQALILRLVTSIEKWLLVQES